MPIIMSCNASQRVFKVWSGELLADMTGICRGGVAGGANEWSTRASRDGWRGSCETRIKSRGGNGGVSAASRA